ncbi:imidazolonepropionase-like domain-containing protein, partial [Hymenobacter agri]
MGGIFASHAQPAGSAAPTATLLRPAAVFDGQERHEGWAVLVENDRIKAVGPAAQLAAPAG